MKLKFFLYTLFVFALGKTYSQNNTVSEIDNLLSKAKSFYKTHQDSALYYSEIAYKKAKKINDTVLIGKTIAEKGTYLISKKKYQEAEVLFQFNLQNKEKITPLDLGITYANIGTINSLKEQRDLALQYYLMAIDIFTNLSEHGYLARNYLNIGVIYENEGAEKQADYFYDKSLFHSDLNKNKELTSTHENVKRGAEENFETKLKISLEALKEIENPNNSRLASVIYHDLSKNYIENKMYKEAIESAKKTIEIKNTIGYTQNIDFSYFILGKAQVRLNQNDTGIANLKTAISLSEKRALIPLMYEMIVLGYKNKADYKNAFQYAENLSKIKDSIATYQENERIAEITSKYQVEKQANDILRLEKENQDVALLLSQQKRKRWQWATLSILFLISSLFLGRKLVLYIQKVKRVEMEKDLIEKKVEAKFLALNNKAKVYLNELDYIKSDGNYLEFYFGEKKVIDRNKMKDIVEELPPNFIQTHRSFIINKNSIQSFNSTKIFLKTGAEIPLSRSFKQNLV
ncbi:MAG: LytTR family transcriptional regulator [Flavobacteriaceae bacterium]